MKCTTQHRLSPVILVAAILSFVGTGVWAFHAFLTTVLSPFDGPLDITIHVIMGILKLTTIAVFPLAIGPLYKRLHRNSRNATAFVLFFTISYLSLWTLYLLLGRELLATYASDSVVRFYYLRSPVLDEFHYIGLEEWREDWARLIPQAKEILLMAICLITLVVPGYLFGPRRRAIVISTLILVLACVILPVVLGLVIWDYDTFLGGVFFDLLSLELIPVFWWHAGPTSVVFFALTTVFYSGLLIFCRTVAQDGTDKNCVQPTS